MPGDEVTWSIRPTGDPEIDAMRQIAVVLEPLDRPARARVVRWAADRFGPEPIRGETDA